MIPDFQTLLIAVVFASQIFVLSFYTPIRWQRYHAFLLERYPREEYPLLHPLPREELERKFVLFRPMHLIIGACACLALLWALFFATTPRGVAGLMQMSLFVQLLPLYIALPLAIRIRQGLSSLSPPSRRSVELRKWRVTEFISPMWIGLGIAGQSLGVVSAVVVHIYRPDTPGILFCAICSGVLLVTSGLTLFGDTMVIRTDPYMSEADTFRARQRIYRGVFLVGAVIGIWQSSTLLFNAGLLHVDLAYTFVVFSVIAQLFALVLVSRQNRELNTRDFSVYRADGGVAVNHSSRV